MVFFDGWFRLYLGWSGVGLYFVINFFGVGIWLVKGCPRVAQGCLEVSVVFLYGLCLGWLKAIWRRLSNCLRFLPEKNPANSLPIHIRDTLLLLIPHSSAADSGLSSCKFFLVRVEEALRGIF